VIKHIATGAALVLILAGCSNPGPEETREDDGASSTQTKTQEEEDAEDQAVEVDEGLFDVEVTVSADFFGELSEEEIASNAEDAEFSDYTINPDGSVTYKMSRGVYEATLAEMKTGINESIQETVDEYPDVIRSVTYDDAVTEFEVVVDRAAYEAEFGIGFIAFTFGIGGMFYQMFEGVPADEQKVVIKYVDDATGEVIDTQTFPIEE
jgi:predicted small lipoprotein YifL